MANQLFAGFAFDDAGAAINGATVNLYDRNTTTPVRATTTTDANGYWAISHATEGRFDVEIVNGTSKRRRKYDDSMQAETLEVAVLRLRNPADTFDYDLVPAAITADRQLNLPLLTGTDTIVSRDSGGASFILHIGDTANAQMTAGLTLNQGASDNEILAFKSSDVAHGMTSRTETDTYGYVSKADSLGGGLWVRGFSETNLGLVLEGDVTTEDTAKTTAALAAIILHGALRSGTDITNMTANANMMVVRDSSSGLAKFIVDADGDILYDGTAAAYDEYDDLSLVRAFGLAVAPQDVVRSEWDTFVRHNEDDLIALGILGGKRTGVPAKQRGLINGSRLQMLHNGAIWQLGQALMETQHRLEVAEAKLAALPAGGI